VNCRSDLKRNGECSVRVVGELHAHTVIGNEADVYVNINQKKKTEATVESRQEEIESRLKLIRYHIDSPTQNIRHAYDRYVNDSYSSTSRQYI